jgi:uncharacterized repeat protein (TIGR03803 family)
VVFKLTAEGRETVLYSFCAQYNGYFCTDGASPYAGLVFDPAGNLYGTTYLGGAHASGSCLHGCGAVFKLTPEGKETVLYSLCAQSNCSDGAVPTYVVRENATVQGMGASAGSLASAVF